MRHYVRVYKVSEVALMEVGADTGEEAREIVRKRLEDYTFVDAPNPYIIISYILMKGI